MKKLAFARMTGNVAPRASGGSAIRHSRVARVLPFALSLALAILSAPSPAAEQDPRSEPRFDLYPGAFVINTKIVEYNTLVLHSKLEQQTPETVSVTGDTRQISYRVNNVSPEKVFRNYEEAVQNAGFDIRYRCTADNCGTYTALKAAAQAFREVPPLDKQPHYLIADKQEAGVPVTFALLVATNNIGEDAYVVTTYMERTPLDLGMVVAANNYQPMSEARIRPATHPHKGDHPLLPRYPGSIDVALTQTDYGSLDLPEASMEASQTSDPLRGQLHQAIYMVRDVSAEKVYLNYKSALEQAGFNVATLCEPDGCPVLRTQLKDIAARLFPGRSARGRHGYYLKAVKGPIRLGLLVTDSQQKGTAFVRQAIMEVEDLETGLIEITSAEIAQQVRHTGKALIYGIYFDTGKAVIKAESTSALEAIQEFLKTNPDMAFYVVGHTDDTGELEKNIELSRTRATAVVKTLVNSHGIETKRLSPQGVGPFAPAAANQTDSGRTQNRRVELVWRLHR